MRPRINKDFDDFFGGGGGGWIWQKVSTYASQSLNSAFSTTRNLTLIEGQ